MNPPPISLALAVAACVVIGAACNKPPSNELIFRPTIVPTPFEDPNAPEETPPPGLAVPQNIEGTRVAAFGTPDELGIVGRVWSIGRSAGVILLHRSDADMRSWEPFAARLAAADYTVLAFDFRGYGQSEGLQEPTKYALDVDGAVDFLNSTGTRRVAIAGLEVGGAAAVAGAARVGRRVQAVAALGAGPAVGSLDVTEQAKKLRLKSLVVSLGQDGAADLSKLIPNAQLESRTAGPNPLGDPALQDLLLRFFAETVPTTRAP